MHIQLIIFKFDLPKIRDKGKIKILLYKISVHKPNNTQHAHIKEIFFEVLRKGNRKQNSEIKNTPKHAIISAPIQSFSELRKIKKHDTIECSRKKGNNKKEGEEGGSSLLKNNIYAIIGVDIHVFKLAAS